MIAVREVSLLGGPMDGGRTVISHDTAYVDGHVYVHVPPDDADTLRFAPAVLQALPEEQRQEEATKVWGLSSGIVRREDLADIPDWRLNAWLMCMRYY